MRKFGCFFYSIPTSALLWAFVCPCIAVFHCLSPKKEQVFVLFIVAVLLYAEKLSTGHFFFAQSLPPFIPPVTGGFLLFKGALHPTDSRQFQPTTQYRRYFIVLFRWVPLLYAEKLSTGHFFFAQSLPPFIPQDIVFGEFFFTLILGIFFFSVTLTRNFVR